MILCLSFCAKDKPIAQRLANWIAELGGTNRHDLLLGYHEDTTPDGIAEVLTPHFNHVGGFKIVEDATTYPEIANMMWKACANKVADTFDAPWFWMEPDGVPLMPEWLDRIEDEYNEAKKPFMLDLVVTPTSRHNSGTGVYPGKVRDYTQRLWQLAGSPWDVFLAPDFMPHTHHTELIHDKFYRVWDDSNSGPPVFPDAASLSIIETKAVIFHRNKDGSLIDRLRESRGGVTVTRPVLIGGETAGSSPAPATSSGKHVRADGNFINEDGSIAHPISDIIARLERIEKHFELSAPNGASASVPAKSGDGVLEPSLKPTRRRSGSKSDTRTPEQIQAAKDRMAKARAGRKK